MVVSFVRASVAVIDCYPPQSDHIIVVFLNIGVYLNYLPKLQFWKIGLDSCFNFLVINITDIVLFA